MNPDSPLADYRFARDAGLAWNMVDQHDRWMLDVESRVPMHPDGLLAVETAIEELRLALEFAVDPALEASVVSS